MPTKIEPPNSAWPAHYTHILERLTNHLQAIPDIKYTHIGSTAISCLPGRSIIDILITVPFTSISSVQESLALSDYTTSPELPEARGFVFNSPSDAQYAHTIYLCELDGLAARAHVAVLDVLTSDATLRDEYRKLKEEFYKHSAEAGLEVAFQVDSDKDNIQDHSESITQMQHQSATPTRSTLPQNLEEDYEQAKSTFLSQTLIMFSPSLPQVPAPHRWTLLSTPRLVLREYELSDVEGMYALESNPANARYQSWEPWTREQARENVVRGVERSYAAERDVVELAVLHEGRFIGRIGGRVHSLSCPAQSSARSEASGLPASTEPVGEVGDQNGDGNGDKKDITCPDSRAPPARAIPLRAQIDLWYSFLPSVQGKGLATEAMTHFIPALCRKTRAQYAKQGVDGCVDVEVDVNVDLELEIECDPRNTASWRLAERLGFKRYSLTERAWECKGEWVDSLVYRTIA